MSWGAALRFYSLGENSLWIDEAVTVHLARLPFREFLRALWAYQGNMALYYCLMRLWIHLGQSEWALRGLSAILGVLTIPAIYLLGARLFDRNTATVAALLVSLHSFHVQWSREARAYSLLVLLLVLAAYFLALATETRLTRHWVAFAVTAAMSFYAHIFAAFVLLAFVIAVAFPKPFQVSRRSVLLAFLIFEHLSAPMAVFVLLQRGSQLNWVQPPTVGAILRFIEVLTGSGGAILAVAYFAPCAIGCVPAFRLSEAGKDTWATRLLLMWLLIPPALTLVLSLIKPMFDDRYMVMCVPALVLLAARGLTRLAEMVSVPRWVPASVLALLLALSAFGTRTYFRRLPFSDWRSAVRYLQDNQQPGDSAVFWRGNITAYEYYLHGTPGPAILYPTPQPQPVSTELLSAVMAGRQRIWLVLHIPDKSSPEYKIVEDEFSPARFMLKSHREFPGQEPITVELYNRRENGQ